MHPGSKNICSWPSNRNVSTHYLQFIEAYIGPCKSAPSYSDALRDFVPFAQFKKPKKHTCRSAKLLKVTLLHGCFPGFLSNTNDIKSYKASHMFERVLNTCLVYDVNSAFTTCRLYRMFNLFTVTHELPFVCSCEIQLLVDWS